MPKKQPKPHREQGERFKEIREALNLSQLIMADIMHTTQSMISQMESGTYTISGAQLAKLNKIAPNLNFNYLIRGEKPLFLPPPKETAGPNAESVPDNAPLAKLPTEERQAILDILKRHQDIVEQDQKLIERFIAQHYPSAPPAPESDPPMRKSIASQLFPDDEREPTLKG